MPWDPANEDFQTHLAKRHKQTQHLMSLFEYGHLPEGGPRQVASHMADVAVFTLMYLDDGPELFAGLRKLIEGKDCFVRQSIVDSRVDEQPT